MSFLGYTPTPRFKLKYVRNDSRVDKNVTQKNQKKPKKTKKNLAQESEK